MESPFAWSSLFSDPVALAIAALVVFGVFWIGLAIGRGRARDAVERARELEDRLQLAEDEMQRYRAEVSAHFGQTSQLLRDLTLQYRNVYEHLAEGARTLCPEAGALLPGSLAEALPAEASEPARSNGSGAAAAEPEDEAQLDLLENADLWHEHAGSEAEDLELDEPLETTPEERRA